MDSHTGKKMSRASCKKATVLAPQKPKARERGARLRAREDGGASRLLNDDKEEKRAREEGEAAK